MLVTLDTTLNDLFHEQGSQTRAVLCPQPLFTLYDSSGTKSTKYIYHYGSILHRGLSEKGVSKRDMQEQDLEEATQLLGTNGQRNAFIAGGMKVVLFDSSTALNPNDGRQDTEATMSVISSEQRPDLVFCSGFDKLKLNQQRNEKLAVLLPVDGLEKQPQVVEPEVLYELLSKRGLAVSGLPTPNAKLIDMDVNESHGSFINKATETIKRCSLPFVLKLQQTVAGFGTYIVKTEADRMNTLQELSSTVLPNLVDLVTPENRHLNPASLVITDFVNSDESMGIAFFIKQSGAPVFISGALQKFDDDQHYDGSDLNFAIQNDIKTEYASLMNKVAAFLHEHGYYGPVGVDVLTDGKAEDAQIVDLNVRIPRRSSWAC